jgi:hypothetical protein
MPGPITKYLRERAKIEAAWQERCNHNGWPGEYGTAEFQKYWKAQIDHDSQLRQLDARHFRLPDNARQATSRIELWAHINKVSLVVFWILSDRSKPSSRQPNAHIADTMSALHFLQVPWAEDPPYPDLTPQEAEDKLRSIANRLEFDDLQADDKADEGKKTIENIADPKLRAYLRELQQIKSIHGKIPRGKKREIARRLCKNNIRAADTLERLGREWKHLIDGSD